MKNFGPKHEAPKDKGSEKPENGEGEKENEEKSELDERNVVEELTYEDRRKSFDMSDGDEAIAEENQKRWNELTEQSHDLINEYLDIVIPYFKSDVDASWDRVDEIAQSYQEVLKERIQLSSNPLIRKKSDSWEELMWSYRTGALDLFEFLFTEHQRPNFTGHVITDEGKSVLEKVVRKEGVAYNTNREGFGGMGSRGNKEIAFSFHGASGSFMSGSNPHNEVGLRGSYQSHGGIIFTNSFRKKITSPDASDEFLEYVAGADIDSTRTRDNMNKIKQRIKDEIKTINGRPIDEIAELIGMNRDNLLFKFKRYAELTLRLRREKQQKANDISLADNTGYRAIQFKPDKNDVRAVPITPDDVRFALVYNDHTYNMVHPPREPRWKAVRISE